MLQLKKISQVLSQGLEAVPIQTTGDTSPLVSPISISLLSNNGVALSTVYNQTTINIDDIKVYSLLIYNYYRNIQDGTNWGVLELDTKLNIMIQKLSLDENQSFENGIAVKQDELIDDKEYYVVILYDKQLPNHIAKYKLDNLVTALNEGLKGI